MNGPGEHIDAMLNPPHLGELVRESMDEVGWSVTETAARLGCERGTLSRLLNGRAGVSAKMALALEGLGWGTADHWMRMQASYELAQARLAAPDRETDGRQASCAELAGDLVGACRSGRRDLATNRDLLRKAMLSDAAGSHD